MGNISFSFADTIEIWYYQLFICLIKFYIQMYQNWFYFLQGINYNTYVLFHTDRHVLAPQPQALFPHVLGNNYLLIYPTQCNLLIKIQNCVFKYCIPNHLYQSIYGIITLKCIVTNSSRFVTQPCWDPFSAHGTPTWFKNVITTIFRLIQALFRFQCWTVLEHLRDRFWKLQKKEKKNNIVQCTVDRSADRYKQRCISHTCKFIVLDIPWFV